MRMSKEVETGGDTSCGNFNYSATVSYLLRKQEEEKLLQMCLISIQFDWVGSSPV